jgi:hypothetical protein
VMVVLVECVAERKTLGCATSFRSEENARFGPNCKHEHVSASKVNLTKGQRKTITLLLSKS